MKISVSTIVLFAMTLSIGFSQPVTMPEIGKPFPDFQLNNVTHYKSSKASLKDFRNKWLALDFWFTRCEPCIRGLSKASHLQDSLKGHLNWVLVGLNNYPRDKDSKSIEILYEKLRTKQNLRLISAYDSMLYMKWSITSMPHIFIIDPNGILRFITDGRDMSLSKFNDLIEGKQVSFFSKDEGTKFDVAALSSSGNGNKQNVLYRSMITRWNGERQVVYDIYQYASSPHDSTWRDGFNLTMVPLSGLYNIAYFGKWYLKDHFDSIYSDVFPEPILEMDDSSAFRFDFDDPVDNGTYNYALSIDASMVTGKTVMKLLQEDLKRTFGYEASVEVRQKPVWKLIATPAAKLKYKTKGGEPYSSTRQESMAAGFTIRNFSVNWFLTAVAFYLDSEDNTTFVDATGMDYNIDFTLDADMTNLESIQKDLRKKGLDLVKGTKPMKVLVIRDLNKSTPRQ